MAEMQICPVCGESFDAEYILNGISRKKKYCSSKCRYEKWKVYYREKYSKVIPQIKKCIVCGKEFIAHRSDHKFCSPNCASKYHRGQGHHNGICPICGKEFTSTRKRKFCSESCSELGLKLYLKRYYQRNK